MSGSIGGDRIKREQVQPTVDKYTKEVLNKFPGFKSASITGSYNAGIKKDHGDIDLAVYIDTKEDIKIVKKQFKKFIEEQPDEITPPFRAGKNQGKKAQMYGAIVTCETPIVGDEEKFVQIDNIIVTTEKDLHFQRSFLNMNAQKQALYGGVMRVLLNNTKDKTIIFKHFGLENLPTPEKNQEFEFVLSTSGLSLRLVTLTDDRHEKSREELWRTNDWDNVKYLLKNYDMDGSYEDSLAQVKKHITDQRSRQRIVGFMKSQIHVGPGEKGTPKGEEKERGIKLAQQELNVSEGMKSLKNYIIEHLQ